MHHVYDETPNDPAVLPPIMPTTSMSHAIYNTHVGRISDGAADLDREQVDTSQYRYVIDVSLRRFLVRSYFIRFVLLLPTCDQATWVQGGLADDWARRTRRVLQAAGPPAVAGLGEVQGMRDPSILQYLSQCATR